MRGRSDRQKWFFRTGNESAPLLNRASATRFTAVFGVLLILGLTVYQSFLFYAFLALITGLRHPPPGNDITPLDPLRKAIGVGTIVLFGLIVTVTPFIVQQ